jgi:adenylyltransferase/sulfurtransferase
MSAERLPGAQVERYAAHLALPGFGVGGHARLAESRIAIVGVGGLGAPAAQYLAASGVGSLTLIDDDKVERGNLHRQVLYVDADVGRPKVSAAAEHLAAGNPDIEILPVEDRLLAANARQLLRGHDVVLDGSDNFATRYVVNDAAVLEGMPLVTGSLRRYEAQVVLLEPPHSGCYRCLFPGTPAPEHSCSEEGVLGPLAGMAGAQMAAIALRRVALQDAAVAGQLVLLDAESMEHSRIATRADPDCGLCGANRRIFEPTAARA